MRVIDEKDISIRSISFTDVDIIISYCIKYDDGSFSEENKFVDTSSIRDKGWIENIKSMCLSLIMNK